MFDHFSRLARLLSRKFDVEVIASETECKTDATKIYLPMLADRFKGEDRVCLNGMLDHEAFHIRASREDDKIGRSNAFRLLDEMEKNVYPFMNAILDARDEVFGRGIYPGSAYNISKMTDIVCDNMNEIDDVPSLIYFLLNGTITEKDLTLKQHKSLSGFFKIADEAREVVDNFGSPDDIYQIAKKLADDESKDEVKKESSKSGSRGNEGEGGGGKESETGASVKADDKEYVFEKAREKIAKAADDEVKAVSKIMVGGRGIPKEHIPHPEALARDRVINPMTDERYIKPWCGRSYNEILNGMSEQMGILINNVRRHLIGQAIDRKRFSRDRGALNTGALYKARYDNRLFTRIEKGIAINSSVSILGDMSGSMCGERETMARSALVSMSYLLDSLSVPFEILGWDTYTGNSDEEFWNGGPIYNRYADMRYYVFKSFNQVLNADVKKNISLFNSQGDCNVDCEAIQWAARRLSHRKEKNRILIVLSDGQPSSPGSNDYIIGQGIKAVIKQCEKADLRVGGVGIQSDAVEGYYKTNEVVWDLSQLGPAIARMFQKLRKD